MKKGSGYCLDKYAADTHQEDELLQTLQSQGIGFEVLGSRLEIPPSGSLKERPLECHCSIGMESRPGESWGLVPQPRPCGPPGGG